jgi:hypothetical protein
VTPAEPTQSELTRPIARRIIETVGAYGAPPEWGFQFFSAGIEPYLNVLERDYLADYVQDGGSAFKLVIGAYGGGKTHFLYSVRELAWRHSFVVAYVTLSAEESPFHRLDRVYAAIVAGLAPPLEAHELLGGAEKGIDAFFKRWVGGMLTRLREQGITGTELVDRVEDEAKQSVADVESTNFAFAVRRAARALAADQEEDYLNILQWITGQGYDRTVHGQYGLRHQIDRSQAFSLIRSLSRWVRALGRAGLVILFDEAEQLPSLSSKQRELMLSNLRELIDECGHTQLQSTMVMYAVPNETFFEGRSNVYEALKQRIATVFDVVNPTGVKIDLERTQLDPPSLLRAIGAKLVHVYEVAFSADFPEALSRKAVDEVGKAAYELRFGDMGYKRLFVQGLVRALHHLRANPSQLINSDWAFDMVQGSKT